MQISSNLKSTRRKTVRIDPFRWASYALAGSAAALSGQSAESDIHVVEVGVDLIDRRPNDGKSSYYHIDLSSQGGFLFGFAYSGPSFGISGGIIGVRERFYGGSGVVSFAGDVINNYAYAHALSRGDAISAGAMTTYRDFELAWTKGYPNSQWIDRGGFLAFQFDVGNGSQFGWAELSLLQGAPINYYRLERYAWADPGESLFAGQTQIPEVGSLGLFALGAMGLSIWRRRRSAVKRVCN
ncbi:MAG: PEP-CTERM sorting domain-containing protein [Planctomycetota bacterium]